MAQHVPRVRPKVTVTRERLAEHLRAALKREAEAHRTPAGRAILGPLPADHKLSLGVIALYDEEQAGQQGRIA